MQLRAVARSPGGRVVVALRRISEVPIVTPYPPSRKFSFFIDSCVMAGIYFQHLGPGSAAFVVPGAADKAEGEDTTSPKDYDSFQFIIHTEDCLNLAEESKGSRSIIAAAPVNSVLNANNGSGIFSSSRSDVTAPCRVRICSRVSICRDCFTTQIL